MSTSDPSPTKWEFVKRCNLPVAKVVYCAQADRAWLKTVSRGIVFFIAWWSNYSVKALDEFLRLVDATNTSGFEIRIFDVDSPESHRILSEHGFRSAGGGETALIVNGRVAKSTDFRDIEIIKTWLIDTPQE